MNWNMLIYAGMAAAAAGLMTALAVFIELKIPETAAFLSGSSRKKGAEEKKSRFTVRRRIISAWPEGVSDTEKTGGDGHTCRTEPLKGRTEEV